MNIEKKNEWDKSNYETNIIKKDRHWRNWEPRWIDLGEWILTLADRIVGKQIQRKLIETR